MASSVRKTKRFTQTTGATLSLLLCEIDGHEIFEIDTSRQIADMIQDRAHLWSKKEGNLSRFFQTTIYKPLTIGHFFQARSETPVIEGERVFRINRQTKKVGS